MDDCIESNSELAEAILQSTAREFGCDLNEKGWVHTADPDDLDKARSTLKQFYRDWSSEGASERKKCYGPIIDVLEKRLGDRVPKYDVKVLVPGAGLGRLAFDIVHRGFNVEGNEFSYHMLSGSNFILNCTDSAEQYTIYPFIHSFSNHRDRRSHLRGVAVPDVHPASELLRETTLEIPDPNDNTKTITVKTKPADHFGMGAGEFVSSYGDIHSKDKFDAVATCFFIDTAPNVIEYLETIHNTLKTGGIWVNFGPLLWHWENKDTKEDNKGGHTHDGKEFGKNSIELSLDEVLILAENMGFSIEERRTVPTGYIQDEQGMMNYEYRAEFWVATKL